MHTLLPHYILTIMMLFASNVGLADIVLSSDTALSTEGYFVLGWESDIPASYVLLQSKSPDFQDAQEQPISPIGSVTITGLENGSYYFRVDAKGAELKSNVLVVEVLHHSLIRAFGFFALGLLLFLVLIITVITGERNEHERKKEGSD